MKDWGDGQSRENIAIVSRTCKNAHCLRHVTIQPHCCKAGGKAQKENKLGIDCFLNFCGPDAPLEQNDPRGSNINERENQKQELCLLFYPQGLWKPGAESRWMKDN